MEKTIYLVRHGEVEARPNVLLGDTDVELNGRGEQQSNWLAVRLADTPIDRCFCSPLLRAQQTATILTENSNVKIETQTALREINFGRWEGRSFAEIETEDPLKAKDWCSDPLNFSFPEGEPVKVFMQNLQTYFHALKIADGEHLLLVTHGGVIRVLLTFLLGLNPEQQFLFNVDRGSLSTVKIYGTTATLTGLNHAIK